MTVRLALSALVVLLAPAVAHAGRCEDLEGRLVVATAKARVVSQPLPGGRRYLGCALPGGVVRRLGVSRPGSPLTVSTPAGPFVLVRATARGRVVDLATGAGYLVYRDPHDDRPQTLSKAPPLTWRLSPLGVFAGVYADLADDFTAARSVRAFTETGAQKLLARTTAPDIPTASLRLAGRTVTWIEAGVARAAVVDAATPAYAPGLEPGTA
jgi:hypothetical protein